LSFASFPIESSVSNPGDGLTEWSEEPGGLRVLRLTDPGRDAAEQYIRSGFFRTHRAQIQSFMPVLVTVSGEPGQIEGALGYRAGGNEPFFLERYLDQPVELAIAERSGRSVDRHTIVEIGNLACESARTAGRLMRALARYLISQRYQWVVFTGTRAVRDILRIFPAPLIELANASEACAGNTGDTWGRYYRSDPRVMAGFLLNAFGATQEREA